jgi:class 3 adenylate cyclase
VVKLHDLPPVLFVRRSFRWKLLLGLLGSVAVLAAVTLLVVRSETGRQIDLVTRQAEQRSREAFVELEEYNRAQLSQLSAVFTGSVQAAAALEGALETRDFHTLAQDVDYEFDARRIPHSLVAFTDADGVPVLAMLNRNVLDGDDPAGIRSIAERVLDDADADTRSYRAVRDSLFSMETMLLDLGRPIGTVSVGVPIADTDAERLGSVIGAEVCFVVDRHCVAATTRARADLEDVLVRLAGRTRSELAEAGGERWQLVSDRLLAGDDAVWRVIAVPLDPVVAPFERVQNALLLGGLAALLLAVIVASVLSRSLTRPVRALVDAASRIGEGDYATRVEVRSIDEMGTLARAFNEMAEGLALKQRYRGVLDKVVSRDVAEELLKGEVVLGGEKREVTTVFADITGFTTITDGMEPAGVIALLNECMELLSEAIEVEGGVVDKYVGDEIMAIFGAPVTRQYDPLRAARAALGMQRAMDRLNTERTRRGEVALRISIGMNTGHVMAGNMGSANRLNYTVLGDAVNMAARIEAMAEGGQILMSEHTLRHLQGHVQVRDLGVRELRGFAQPVGIFELLALSPGAPEPDRPGQLRRSTPRAAVIVGAALVAALVMPAPAAAQAFPELPTLQGITLSSASGWFQAGFSGRLDIDAYLPQDDPAWIIPSTSPFVAPRLRIFSDAFFGERILASAELRVDRGEEPAAGDMEARVDQLFIRFIPAAPVALQLGKFVSPFGGWAQRHHSGADPFVRPPLPHDYRTVLTAHHAPSSAVALATWKNAPDAHRPRGAPVIWGAPYQWGAMLMGSAGKVSWRAAAMNSAPSSEPEEWGLARGFSAPSYVASAGIQLHPALRLELSFDTGPWMTADATGLAAGADPSAYSQRIWGAEAIWKYGNNVLRGELFHDTWGVPNVGYNVVDLSWYAEAERTIVPGLTVAGRYGMIHFSALGDGYYAEPGLGTGDDAKWDYDVSRLQLSAGYRLARNAGVLAEMMFNDSASPESFRDNLLSLQLWWEF